MGENLLSHNIDLKTRPGDPTTLHKTLQIEKCPDRKIPKKPHYQFPSLWRNIEINQIKFNFTESKDKHFVHLNVASYKLLNNFPRKRLQSIWMMFPQWHLSVRMLFTLTIYAACIEKSKSAFCEYKTRSTIKYS